MPLRLRIFFSFFAFVSLFATHSFAAENSSVTDATRHEMISVQAPFAMPAIAVPVFPQRTFVVTNFSAVEGGDISEAIRQAIAACHDAGGGSMVIPRGRWLTGKIHFQSNSSSWNSQCISPLKTFPRVCRLGPFPFYSDVLASFFGGTGIIYFSRSARPE
jgi:hypothetical protein